MALQTINGNNKYSQVEEYVNQLNQDDRLQIEFSGTCDDRSDPVLTTIAVLDKLKVRFRILAKTSFEYDPNNNQPHMRNDCYSLIGKKGGGAVHPQNVNQITVFGSEDLESKL